MEARLIPMAPRCILGEGPTWLAVEDQLLWVDIVGQAVHTYGLSDQRVTSLAVDEAIGWVLPSSSPGVMIAGLKSGFWEFDLQQGKRQFIGDPEVDRPDNRLNDAKVDPAGRIWAGSKHDLDQQSSGALYRLDTDKRWHRIDDNYGVANGPAFSPDGSVLYHTDSAIRTIYRFDVDRDGILANKSVWLQFPDDWGYPDGMTTDNEGCVWIAHWGGWGVSRFSPTGERIDWIALPAKNVTSCCFAGPQADRLFVTSAALDDDEGQHGGCLFEIEAGVAGLPSHAFGAA